VKFETFNAFHLVTMSYEELERLLYEKERQLKINQYLIEFYTEVIEMYKKTGDTTHVHPFDSQDPFIIENMPTILEEIKEIFPDCSIQYSVQGRNGEMVILTEANEERVRVIEWV